MHSMVHLDDEAASEIKVMFRAARAHPGSSRRPGTEPTFFCGNTARGIRSVLRRTF